MLSASALKETLKSDLTVLFNNCNEGDEGMYLETYADRLAGIIARRVVSHITEYAKVTPGADWTINDGGYVRGSATGTVS